RFLLVFRSKRSTILRHVHPLFRTKILVGSLSGRSTAPHFRSASMCVGAGRMCIMPKAFPKEFREDVIRVYRESDASMAQVAKDFGISPSCLKRWLAIDEKNSARSSRSPQSGSESDALREANKRIKLLEQENEVLRRAAAYLSQAHLPGK